jgi:hypothetical protein
MNVRRTVTHQRWRNEVLNYEHATTKAILAHLNACNIHAGNAIAKGVSALLLSVLNDPGVAFVL